LYEVPFDPVTWIEAALVSVTVRVTVCPEVMLLELALIATVGTAAAALAVKAEIATKVTNEARKGPKDFISSHDVHSSRFALWCEVFRLRKSRPRPSRGMDGYKGVGCIVGGQRKQPKFCTVVIRVDT
jgi:hypothetical protein